jgi:hypothetical protein
MNSAAVGRQIAEALRDEADRERRAPAVAEGRRQLNESIHGMHGRHRARSDANIQRLFPGTRPKEGETLSLGTDTIPARTIESLADGLATLSDGNKVAVGDMRRDGAGWTAADA